MKSKTKKKRGKWWLVPFLVVALLCAYIAYTWLQQQQEQKSRFAMYPGFNIELPVGYPMHGIDVSTYQQYIYWPAVKKMQVNNVKIGFTFIKATEGLANADKQFKRNWQNAKEAGIPCGAYHYFLATKDGKAQAINFINHVKLQPGDLPPVLDVEQLYGVAPQLMQQRVKDWLHAVEASYKVKPIIYSSANFYNKYLGQAFDNYPLWVAHYFEKNKPRVERTWQFWQHNSTGHINGITTGVDFNVFNGDSVAFNALLIK